MFAVFDETCTSGNKTFEPYHCPSAMPPRHFGLSKLGIGPKGIYYLPAVELGLKRFANKSRKDMENDELVVVKGLKSCAKSIRHFTDVLRFLNPNLSTKAGEDAHRCSISLTGGSILESFELDMLNIDPYAELQFHSSTNGLSTRQISLRTHNLSPSKQSLDSCISGVNIVTGVCLFNEILLAEHQAKPEDWSFLSNHPATLYETETLTRLSATIADVIEYLPADIPINLTLDLPSIQYLLSNPLLRSHQSSGNLYTAWFAVVALRRQQLERAFRKVLAQRLGGSRLNLNIRCSSSLDDLVPYLDQSAERLHELSVEGMTAHLASTNGTWREFLARLKRPIRSETDFIALGYVYELIRPVLAALDDEHENTTTHIIRQEESVLPKTAFLVPIHTYLTPPPSPNCLPDDRDPMSSIGNSVTPAGQLKNQLYGNTSPSDLSLVYPSPSHTPQPQPASGQHLTLVIDNPGERRTFIEAKDFLKHNDSELNGLGTDLAIIGMYPMEKLFVQNPRRRSSLYSLNVPEAEHGAKGVLDMVYGREIVECVYQALQEVGL